MKLPLRWLREYLVEVPDADELAERLTMAGLEVENVRRPQPALVEHLVVARITELGRHPNADRLSLCRVDDGSATHQIVCGASNMSVGDAVVLARPGAQLPAGLEIKKSKIRGEASEGMLCSAAELGLGDDHSGIMILGEEVTVGDAAAELLGLDDHVLEITVTPNRGDCLSIRGLAREVSAVCGIALEASFSERLARPAGKPRYKITIDSPQACSLYRGVEVRDVTLAASPAWLVTKLSACGLRPINNVVDVTNLVLLEFGQPLHAFDSDLLQGKCIGVRTVDGDTEVETLDNESRTLHAGDLAIWDDAGPIAIAGVMGGARTAVHEGTDHLFLEAAVFAPTTVRATSRRLGLISESSYRFERGVDPTLVEQALLRAATMIAELGGGSLGKGVAGAGEEPGDAPAITLRPQRVQRVLGVEIDREEIVSTLEALGAKTTIENGVLSVVAPRHRNDIAREVDLIEEVARIRGYEKAPVHVPKRPMQEAVVPPLYAFHQTLRQRLCSVGLSEAVGLAFCSQRANELFVGLHAQPSEAVVVKNPMRADATEMRKSVLPCLFDAHAVNARGGVGQTDFFTLGRTFSHYAGRGDGSGELDAVGGILWGPRRARGPGSAGPATFWDAKAAVDDILAAAGARHAATFEPCTDRLEYHPRACATVQVGGRPVGYLGMVHPDVAEELEIPHEISAFEVDSRKLLDYAPGHPVLRPIPRYPASSRDVSLLVPAGLLAGNVIAAVEALGEPLIETVFVFDEYTGEGVETGYRALAFSMVYRSADGTLTDQTVAALHDKIVEHLVDQLGVRVRA